MEVAKQQRRDIRSAQSGQLLWLSLAAFEAWNAGERTEPAGLAFMGSPLGGIILCEYASLEYCAMVCLWKKQPHQFLKYVVKRCKHPPFLAELLFECEKICEFEELIATNPYVMDHLMGLEIPGPQHRLQAAQNIARIALAKSAALAALGDF